MPALSDMSTEQQHLLRTAASHLAREFEGTFGRKTIEEFLASSYDQFAAPSDRLQLPAAARRALRPPTPQGPTPSPSKRSVARSRMLDRARGRSPRQRLQSPVCCSRASGSGHLGPRSSMRRPRCPAGPRARGDSEALDGGSF